MTTGEIGNGNNVCIANHATNIYLDNPVIAVKIEATGNNAIERYRMDTVGNQVKGDAAAFACLYKCYIGNSL